MQKQPHYASPDEYVASLSGWQLPCVVALRGVVKRSAALDERVKWGHLVYFSKGPVLLIRAEPSRLLFGFWRGQRLREIEPRLKPGGKYEMATLVLQPTTPLTIEVVEALTVRAVALNRELGDPTRLG
ncbi:MAG: DUF1801 domain-containing protein [Burkholderiaceae bacterium]